MESKKKPFSLFWGCMESSWHWWRRIDWRIATRKLVWLTLLTLSNLSTLISTLPYWMKRSGLCLKTNKWSKPRMQLTLSLAGLFRSYLAWVFETSTKGKLKRICNSSCKECLTIKRKGKVNSIMFQRLPPVSLRPWLRQINSRRKISRASLDLSKRRDHL